MMETNMTLPFAAVERQFTSVLNIKRERFIRLCNTWDSAELLAFDLADIGYVASPRTVRNWRNRTTKKIPYAAVQAVKYLVEHKKLQESYALSAKLKAESEAL